MQGLGFFECLKSCELVELLIVHFAPLRSDNLVEEDLDIGHRIEAGLPLKLTLASIKGIL